MQTPLRITYHQMDSSEALNELIREEVDKLESFFDRIISCRVAIEQPHRHHRQGKHFRVRVDVTVPNEQIVVGRDPAEHAGHVDPRLAVSDAFRAASRKLQDYVRRIRYEVKLHEEPPHGRVSRLEKGYGFIESDDGREIYFHANSVLEGGFAQLEVGTPVRFVEELGDKGPQASTVVPLRAGRAASSPQP
ncbi:MAG: HPF/RaiA family ribosome-associated protein [Myxococcaceae bacterium]